MTLYLRLALRNVFRNRGRTAIALSAIAAGCAALIVNGGVIHDIFAELREDAIHGRHGHLQIYRRGYSEHHLAEPGRYLMPQAEVLRILDLTRGVPGVRHATRRRELSGMISAGDRYVAFLGIAVEPGPEAQLSRHVTLRAGEDLSDDDPRGVIAGLGLAEKFAGVPGSSLTLLTSTETGALNALDVRLRGVFEGGMKAYDDWTLKLPFPAAEELLLDDRTEQVVVLLERTEDLERVRGEIERRLAGEGLDVETRSWRDLALFHNQTRSLFERELDVIGWIVATIVVLGIANTIGMAILERRVELATLRALGLGRRAVGGLLLTEAALTGLLGGLLGVALGALLAAVVSAIGIPFPSPPGSTRPFQGGVDFVPRIVLHAFLLSVASTLAAALLPVWRATRRSISSELRG